MFDGYNIHLRLFSHLCYILVELSLVAQPFQNWWASVVRRSHWLLTIVLGRMWLMYSVFSFILCSSFMLFIWIASESCLSRGLFLYMFVIVMLKLGVLFISSGWRVLTWLSDLVCLWSLLHVLCLLLCHFSMFRRCKLQGICCRLFCMWHLLFYSLFVCCCCLSYMWNILCLGIC